MTTQNITKILITGSTSGIGLGIAKVFIDAGYKVILQGLEDEKSANAIFSGLGIDHNIIHYKCLDLSNCDAIINWCSYLKENDLAPDVLINNAGFQYVSPAHEFNLDMFEKLLKVNLTAPFVLIKELLSAMQARKWGRIINIASAHGLVASINKSGYVASKHGLVGLTKVVALESAKLGITCNAICPGWVLTPLVEKQIRANMESQNISFEQAQAQLVDEKQPTGAFATAEQIGALALYLATDAAKQITGSCIPIDGGWTAQ